MKFRKTMVVAAAALLAVVGFAGPTSTLTKTRLARSKAVVPGRWHADLAKSQAYAKANGVPLIAVWSNGDACGHCSTFAQTVTADAFTKWMKTSGIVFCFVHSGDGAYGAQNGKPYNFCWGSSRSLAAFPFVRVWWYTNNGKTKKVDVAATGDTVNGGQGKGGAKKAVAWFRAKLKNFNPIPPDPELPYTIAFHPNYPSANVTGEGRMEPIAATYGTALALPSNAFTCVGNYAGDYVFSGWATTATGSVAYKNGVSVQGLTSTSNKTVEFYARWTRMIYGPYYTGVKKTIKPTSYTGSAYKGWAAASRIPGLTWNKTKGYWTGTPTKAGAYTVKFTKGSSSTTRKFVVVKDEVELADLAVDADTKTVTTDTGMVFSNAIAAVSGSLSGITVAGLPDGIKYENGAIVGRATTPGSYTVTVSGTARTGQKVKTVFTFEVAEGNAILLNGLAHADELWTFTGTPLNYPVSVKVKLDANKYELVPVTDEAVTDRAVTVLGEDGVSVGALALDEKGSFTGQLDKSGIYTVTIKTTVTIEGQDKQDLFLTFKVNALALTSGESGSGSEGPDTEPNPEEPGTEPDPGSTEGN